MTDTCEVCGQEPGLVPNLEDGKLYGVNCAANAGEPTALQLRAHKEATRILDRILMPVQELEEVIN